MYKCELCNKEFNQKGDLTKHRGRKFPCISLENIQELNASKTNDLLQLETKDDIVKECTKELNKNKVINIFKACLNILRDSEGLTGEKALRNLSYLLTLKLIEPQIGIQIDIDNYRFKTILKNEPDEDDTNEELINKQIRCKLFQDLIPLARYSNLIKQDDVDLSNSIKKLWDDILSEHPSTMNIFLKGGKFDIKNTSTFRLLFKKINEIDTNITNSDFDILGASYEEVIKDIMVGKVLGQFFTQPLIKTLMVELLNPQLREDGTFNTIADPTMGTGGFLISYLNEIIKQSRASSIPLNYEFIKSAIYGKEIDPDTYQLAVSNMLISSGIMMNELECGDSIRRPILKKFDNILANPPFGIKGLKYNGFDFAEKDEYIPIKSDNAVSLFIQAIIYMLKVDGKCAVVLPDGQDLFSKSNTTLVAIREYLVKTCDLKEIIYMPNNSFTNTGVKTCVFFFVKKKEGANVMVITSKKAKGTNRELKRNYTFIEDHATERVKFYTSEVVKMQGSIDTKLEKVLLIEVPIDDLKKNSYSLNYTEYIESSTIEYNNDIKIKSFGDICEFKNGYAFKSDKYENKDTNNIGIVQIKSIQGGIIDKEKITEYIKENKKYNTFKIQKGDILIGLTGTFKIGMYTLPNASYLNQRVCKIIPKLDININYIYYWYIYFDIESKIEQLAKGTAQANISTSELANIQVPIPSIGRQNEIVQYLDFIHKSIITTNLLITEIMQLNFHYLDHQAKFGKNELKKLGDVCEFLPKSKRQASYGQDTGEYPFYTSSQSLDKYSTIADYKDLCLIIGTGGNANIKMDINFSCSTDNLIIRTNNDILTKYLYYYLYLNIHILQNEFHGVTIKHISKAALENINIPIPSPERQSEIVSYCENNKILITQLEKKIISNKLDAREYLSIIISI